MIASLPLVPAIVVEGLRGFAILNTNSHRVCGISLIYKMYEKENYAIWRFLRQPRPK